MFEAKEARVTVPSKLITSEGCMKKNNEDLKHCIMDFDRQFDMDTAIGGVAAWVSYFADDGVMVVGHGGDIKGKEAILAHMARPFSLPGFFSSMGAP